LVIKFVEIKTPLLFEFGIQTGCKMVEDLDPFDIELNPTSKYSILFELDSIDF